MSDKSDQDGENPRPFWRRFTEWLSYYPPLPPKEEFNRMMRSITRPPVAGEHKKDSWRIPDPTARADAIAEEVREWYEKHRETWWERHMPVSLGGNRNMRRIASDNFMLWLVGEVQASIERMKKKDLELPEALSESVKATGQKE